MSVNDVKEAVLQISHTADRFGRWLERNNLAMRYAVVDPILWALGWRTWLPQECRPDFQLGNRGRVDYALLDDVQDPGRSDHGRKLARPTGIATGRVFGTVSGE